MSEITDRHFLLEGYKNTTARYHRYIDHRWVVVWAFLAANAGYYTFIFSTAAASVPVSRTIMLFGLLVLNSLGAILLAGINAEIDDRMKYIREVYEHDNKLLDWEGWRDRQGKNKTRPVMKAYRLFIFGLATLAGILWIFSFMLVI